jgi:hypothetical protein
MKTLRIDIEKLAKSYGIDVLYGSTIELADDGRTLLEITGDKKPER